MTYMSAGERHGRWVLLEDAPKGAIKVLCRCECGTERQVDALSMRSGLSKSCGCLKRELRVQRNTSHGLSSHPLYSAWLHMVDRCTKPADPGWPDYGGRGIRVCARWLGDAGIANFIIDMGPKPTPLHSLDRLDNNGNYEPGNCAWTTKGEQARNTRPKIRSASYLTVLAEIDQLRVLVVKLGGDPGPPFQPPPAQIRHRVK